MELSDDVMYTITGTDFSSPTFDVGYYDYSNQSYQKIGTVPKSSGYSIYVVNDSSIAIASGLRNTVAFDIKTGKSGAATSVFERVRLIYDDQIYAMVADYQTPQFILKKYIVDSNLDFVEVGSLDITHFTTTNYVGIYPELIDGFVVV